MSVLRFRWLVVSFVWGAALSGCGEAPRAGNTEVRPRRVVSLGPAATEIVVSLGAMDRLVGRSRWDKWPDTVRVVPELGDAIRPSLERILAARPDLVVMYPAADNTPSITALQQAGVRVVALRIDSVQEFLQAVDSLGTLLGTRRVADSIGTALRAELDQVRMGARSTTRVRAFFPVWDQPLMTVGQGSFLSELLEVAGGTNIYGDAPEPSLTVSLEDVIRRDPDVVLTTPRGKARLLADTRWQALRAVREGRVLAYDTMLVSQPSTRLGAAAASLATLLVGERR